MEPNMLRSVMVRNGDNVAALAAKMGLSHTALYRRINGEGDFSLAEMTAIKQIYGLTIEEIDAIFFSK